MTGSFVTFIINISNLEVLRVVDLYAQASSNHCNFYQEVIPVIQREVSQDSCMLNVGEVSSVCVNIFSFSVIILSF
jgi:hypothetical protein